jgi:hypothetical protein
MGRTGHARMAAQNHACRRLQNASAREVVVRVLATVKPSGPTSVMATCTKATVPCMSVLSMSVLSMNVLRCTGPINRSSRLAGGKSAFRADLADVRLFEVQPREAHEKVD